MGLINIGYGNYIASHRVVAIVSPDAAPVKRTVQEARESGRLIDATHGRKTRAVVVCDSGHVIVSAIQPETMAARFEDGILHEAAPGAVGLPRRIHHNKCANPGAQNNPEGVNKG